MSLSSVVENDIELLKKSKKKLLEACDPENHSNWQPSYYNDPKIKVYNENVGKVGCGCVSGIGTITGNPTEILNEIRNKKNWKKMDSMLESGEYIDLSPDSRIVHLTFSGLLNIVSKRDVVYIETVKKQKDGSIIITSANTNLDLYPESAEYVRAELRGGGWYIRPVSKTESLVTYYTSADFKLPYLTSQMINFFTAKVPTIIKTIGEIVGSKTQERLIASK